MAVMIASWLARGTGLPFASDEADFAVRNGLDDVTLVELFSWGEDDFKSRLAGSPIYRIGYARWLRNIVRLIGQCAGYACRDRRAAGQAG